MEAVAAIVLVVLTVRVISWYRKRPRRAAGETPTFRVLALGPAGAGKSMFLASMYSELKSADGRGYHLRLPDLTRKQKLNSIYAQVCDPDVEWPAGTHLSEFSRFDFECVGPTGDSVFTLSYLDYSGELLESATPEYEQDRERLMEEAHNAHAIFGMIDGRQVVRFLDDQPDAVRYFNYTIQTMLDVLSEARCPIHLIVTKWDLVRAMDEPSGGNDNVLLAVVRDALLNDADVDRLVEDRGLGERVIRLIPVSAVGDGFAAIAGDGTVKKRGESKPHPLNIDVPLAAVVPDLFNQLLGTLDDAEGRKLNLDGLRARALGRVGVLSLGARSVLLNVLGYPASYGATAIIDLFVSWTSLKMKSLVETTTAVTAPAHAGQRVLDAFQRAIRRLESTVPSSVIHTRSRSDV